MYISANGLEKVAVARCPPDSLRSEFSDTRLLDDRERIVCPQASDSHCVSSEFNLSLNRYSNRIEGRLVTQPFMHVLDNAICKRSPHGKHSFPSALDRLAGLFARSRR